LAETGLARSADVAADHPAKGPHGRTPDKEKVTGARPDRRELLRMLERLEPGDVVTVTRIDRLSRSRQLGTMPRTARTMAANDLGPSGMPAK
jgi:hypothetical protein